MDLTEISLSIKSSLAVLKGPESCNGKKFALHVPSNSKTKNFFYRKIDAKNVKTKIAERHTSKTMFKKKGLIKNV